FEALVTELCANDFVRKGSAIARISHQPMLPAKLQPVERKIREALSQKPFDPPTRREIEVDRGSQHVLSFVIERDEVIELGLVPFVPRAFPFTWPLHLMPHGKACSSRGSKQ